MKGDFLTELKDAAKKRRETTNQPYATGEENDLVAYNDVVAVLGAPECAGFSLEGIAREADVPVEFARMVMKDRE
jgi:hypothetical protein